MPKTNETETKRLEERAMNMLSWDDYVVGEYRKDPEWAKYRVSSELEEYTKTGDIQYLLSTLRDVAAARGWVSLAKETGLSRPTLYETLNGRRQPRVDTLTKILNALGFRMLFVAVDHDDMPPKNTKSVPAVKSTQRKRAVKTSKSKQEKQLQRA